jgi:hypothetical protein
MGQNKLVLIPLARRVQSIRLTEDVTARFRRGISTILGTRWASTLLHACLQYGWVLCGQRDGISAYSALRHRFCSFHYRKYHCCRVGQTLPCVPTAKNTAESKTTVSAEINTPQSFTTRYRSTNTHNKVLVTADGYKYTWYNHGHGHGPQRYTVKCPLTAIYRCWDRWSTI